MESLPVGAEARLKELGIELPGMQPAIGNYLATKRHGDLVFVAGHGPLRLEQLSGDLVDGYIPLGEGIHALIQGRVGEDLTLEEAKVAARNTTLVVLSSLRHELGSLDEITSFLKVFGMVNCAPGFNQFAAVIDGCSDLLVEIFGEEIGKHARSAVGMAALPLDISVELEMIVAVRPLSPN